MDTALKKLKEEAERVQKMAYAPYSKFNVGAALLSSDGNIYSGCNVENGSFGLTVCAERNAIFEMVKNGGKSIKRLVVIGETEKPLSPCGACRQVIAEFGDSSTEIYMFNQKRDYQVVSLNELIPYVFQFNK